MLCKKNTDFAAKLEEDTKRRQEDGYDDVNESCCAHSDGVLFCFVFFFLVLLRKNLEEL